MQIVDAVRQGWRVNSFPSRLAALGLVEIAELARENAVIEAEFHKLSFCGDTPSLLRGQLQRLGFDFEQMPQSNQPRAEHGHRLRRIRDDTSESERSCAARRLPSPPTVLPEHGSH